MSTFDLTGPLPLGTTVLEASAGTGKTYAIVGLAARYVAEGVTDIAGVLLVTFSKGATRELRERTRARFAEVAAALADPSAARAGGDELIALLADVDDDEVVLRRTRLLTALSEFDAGTIATTHSFCQRMLGGLGIAGEREPDAAFVESVDDIVVDVVDDLYLRRYSAEIGSPPLSVADARTAARAAVADRRARLSPDAPEDTAAGQRVRLALEAREETERRKRRLGVRDFDDLLELLHGVLSDETHGPAACARVREKFTVVLVDEFQDTDPLQWSILRRAFHGHCTLVLVGDPKQAIYAFRGAEVLSYLDAVAVADRHLALTTNWRSDAAVIGSLAHLYEGAALGHPDIVVTPVTASHREPRLLAAATQDPLPPVRLRVFGRTGSGPLNNKGLPTTEKVRLRIADDVAHDIVELLDGDATLVVDGASPRPVAPGDVAVLVRSGRQAEMVRAALERAGVPSVLYGGSSVFATESAVHWLKLLQALEQPHRADVVRRAALTPLLGWSARDLDDGGDAATSALSARCREWSALVAGVGFAAMVENLTGTTELQKRLLATESGERDLTDLRHLAQLVQRESLEGGHGLTSLTRWLADRVQDPTSGTTFDRSRRLDSDAEAVQVATVHAMKGLEFPVVYVPFAWGAAGSFAPDTLLFHDDEGARVRDVGGASTSGYGARKQRHDHESAGEEMRLLYVALTRAQCRLVLWWAPTAVTAASPLHRLLFGRVPGIAEPESTVRLQDDASAAATLRSRCGSAIVVETVQDVNVVTRPARTHRRGGGALAVARFERRLDTAWRRTSYSALTAGAHDQPVEIVESEDPILGDEPVEDPFAAGVGAGAPSLMNGLPAGAAFGTLVHEILEYVDTSVDDLPAEVQRRCVSAVAAHGADIDADHLSRALTAVLRTPLDFGAAGSGTLADVHPSNRLAEMDFEIPLSGGDHTAAAHVTVHAVADLVADHLASDDVLAAYPQRMRRLDDRTLRGYLTGSVDTVLRVGLSEDPRYVVVDYKTNRIRSGDLTVDDFTVEDMAGEMMESHYPLQALLYSVALHRYLRWRRPGYDPRVHLGGVQYHFVRGMIGPDTPPGRGVFAWAPSADLVTALSDLLAGVRS
ncbi:UvrD-helicase domain-containing protein [Rhodococcus sp. BP-349]|uniref:UvrD-helicase domain-containing protein n=1 Tax=unclassified Rhodococcus (in: high G+C Gram-positive bacteria) TaxID=192944 RepID=UPI001C9AF5ED|nr:MULTISPECIES: UvrD-helicase domain-containing protein [unclassified Rhodococcus (in: high G+C Gram-positive bacteria)]MBY6540156.1 UvrD-helicase domain-containing protein [Rhodococcus sp. BP-363]MBY6543516.1 UvrD-helicase domain-containing protein [Rhodococcus sp. BP-369]MBY6562746.1 UvrD-helicase domain-containing protein [Rhodococcus sp. BP-370]MBY6577038.1 UvrD-helicase domain-containing protein [Rhodococcus sp. BP-364]MBY6586339.1 UvrD-helicase domain-containing protein [Rhodococcus sp.